MGSRCCIYCAYKRGSALVEVKIPIYYLVGTGLFLLQRTGEQKMNKTFHLFILYIYWFSSETIHLVIIVTLKSMSDSSNV